MLQWISLDTKETEAQGGELTCMRSRSQEVAARIGLLESGPKSPNNLATPEAKKIPRAGGYEKAEWVSEEGGGGGEKGNT